MDTIIATHMTRKDAAAFVQVCPGIRIHAIDIVHPPGIAISPIDDMETDKAIVSATLAANITAATAKKTRCEGRSETMWRNSPFIV